MKSSTTIDQSMFVFSGLINEANLTDIVNKVEVWLSETGETAKLKRKVITIAVELLQNIIIHSSEKNCTFILKNEDLFYNIIAGSWILKNNASLLKETIKKVNNYSTEELANAIDLQLKTDANTEKIGAGVGLLYTKEIASSEIKLYEIDWDNFKTLLRIETTVNKNNNKINVS